MNRRDEVTAVRGAGNGRPAGDGGDERAELDARARRLAAGVVEQQAPTELLLVLRVGRHRFGLPAARARHVAAAGTVTPVATSNDVVGIAAVLGEVIAVVDLNLLFGEPASALDRRDLVMVDDRDERIGLLVDEVVDLVAFARDDSGGRGDDGDVEAATELPGGIVEVISLDELLADPRLADPRSGDRRPGEATPVPTPPHDDHFPRGDR